jgi:hypothetical protein
MTFPNQYNHHQQWGHRELRYLQNIPPPSKARVVAAKRTTKTFTKEYLKATL